MMLASAAPPICPHCGFDLDRDIGRADGRFAYDRRDGFFVDGVKLALAPQCVEIVAAVFRMRGGILPYAAIADRCGSEASDLNNWISVQMNRIRATFSAAGVDCPIERVWGEGLRWRIG